MKKWKRCGSLIAACAVAAMVLAAIESAWGEEAEARMTPRHNVLLIVVDDLRPALGCYGHPVVKSPHIDRLAETGMLFTRAYCQFPSCCPSRTSMLTGLRPETTQVLGNADRHFREHLPDCVTLPQHFQAHGAWCQELGKVFHLRDPQSWSEPKWIPEPPLAYPIYRKPENVARQRQAKVTPKPDDWWGYAKWIKADSWEDPDVADGELFDGMLADKAIELLEQNKDRRFFLAAGFFRPHLPLIAPKRYFDLYPPEAVKLPENRRPPEAAPDIAIHASPESRSYDDVPRQGPLEERKQLELLRAYYASVSYVDAQIGRVLAALEKNGLAESTVVVLVSDHGYHFGEHGMWNKLTNFEEATRSTLIVRAPGHPPGRCDRLVELLDIYPTLSELCGLPPPDGLAGASFAPLLVDPTATGKAAAFSQADPRGAMGYSIRTEQFRYVQWKRDGAMIAEELYDHQSDPGENVNVAGRGEFQAALAKMRKMASTWTEE